MNTNDYRVTGKVRLRDYDPDDVRLAPGKAEAKEKSAALQEKLAELQELVFAGHERKVLILLQGMDASGKDGTIRHVMGGFNPQGTRVVSFGKPAKVELDHDYLWRVHQQVPAKGEVVVFNRSHYEDVLVPVVNGQLTAQQVAQRYRQINEFERMLTEHGTVLCKFMLHISKDEQRSRLQARLDDPAKHWKFDVGDLDVRKRWKEYMAAYDAAIRATGTPWAPWTVVPADSKTHRNLMVATLMAKRLRALKLRPPPPSEALSRLRIS